MKEIIQWHENFYPTLGGGPAHLDNLISQLNTTFKFKLITDYVSGTSPVDVYAKNVGIYRFPPKPLIPPKWLRKRYVSIPCGVIHELQTWASKLKYLKKTHFDLIHVHGVALHREILRLSRLLKKDIYQKLFNFSFIQKTKLLTLHNFFPGFTTEKTTIDIYNHYIDSFDNIICVDKQIYDYCVQHCQGGNSKKAIWFIPNSIDTKKFFYAHPQPSPKFKIGFVGRIANTVDVEMINSLLSRLPKEMEFFIAVTGDVRLINIPQSVEDRVKIIQDVPQQEMPSFYHQLDVLFNPVLHQGMTRAALEAMACGRPVIMYRMGNKRPYIDEKNAFIIDKDVSALMTLLRLIANDCRKLEEMGKNASQFINEKLSNEVIIPQIEKIYNDLLEKTNGRKSCKR
jgi:glycosyltransferase involved in cell wall biosynthesis